MMIEIGLETLLGAVALGWAFWKTDNKLALAIGLGGLFLVLSGRFSLGL
tara:strand:- start:602 stop:748 length:147 start_codon:yes stop_codon:yes gene_type:complete